MTNALRGLETLEQEITDKMADVAIPTLRVSLGVTYIWFGALKIIGVSPVDDLVGKTVPLVPDPVAVRLLGVVELAIGLAMTFRFALRLTLPLFFLQVTGTFLTFVRHPGRMFQDNNPLLLSKDGEFVLKNLVLLAAGLAVGSTLQRGSEDLPDADQEIDRSNTV